MLPKVFAIFSIVFGGGFTSEATIIGSPNSEIYFTISPLFAYLLLKSARIFPFVSRIAMPVVVPGSRPTIVGLARLAPHLIFCN